MRDYFCGWYFKCQSETHTLAVIPAVHTSKKGESCSIQLITDEGAWNFVFPHENYHEQKKDFHIQIGENSFDKSDIRLILQTPECAVIGSLQFGELSPIRYDIMGPFKYVPFMECRHSVVSIRHTVNGELHINNATFRFENAVGYIEGDRGYSFPKEYAWTQCFFDDESIMLSIADIPFGLFHFTGIIGVILLHGREYRIATYLGAKAVKIENGKIVIRQGDAVLTVKLIEKKAHPLHAPVGGVMSRTIHESASCRALYRFEKNGQVLFSYESDRASFEYEYLK